MLHMDYIFVFLRNTPPPHYTSIFEALVQTFKWKINKFEIEMCQFGTRNIIIKLVKIRNKYLSNEITSYIFGDLPSELWFDQVKVCSAQMFELTDHQQLEKDMVRGFKQEEIILI